MSKKEFTTKEHLLFWPLAVLVIFFIVQSYGTIINWDLIDVKKLLILFISIIYWGIIMYISTSTDYE